MPPVGFEPTISAGERPQTYVLDRAATGAGQSICSNSKNMYDKNHVAIHFLFQVRHTRCVEHKLKYNIIYIYHTQVYILLDYIRIAATCFEPIVGPPSV